MSVTKLELLKSCSDRKDLARLLGYKPKSLAYILYQRTPAQNYKTFTLKKRSGGDRVIDAPREELCLLQKRTSKLLQDCLQDILIIEGHKSPIHHGFQRHKSIVTNAKPHRARKFVFNIDISDYFHSINFGRVLGYFRKNRHFALCEEVAVTLAQICCYEGRLPQGAPTSPVMSNLISQILDLRLSRLAEKNGCGYSRYADDITFSTSDKKFPKYIAKKHLFSHEWRVGKSLKKEMAGAGFEINQSKTRMLYSQSRQTVTGLIVNSKVNVPVEFRRATRAMANQLVTTGSFFVPRVSKNDDGEVVVTKEPGEAAQIIGRFSHIRNVKLSEFSKSNPQPDALAGYEKDYRRLLLYAKFFSPKKPLMVVEGKTDSVYLKAALRKLQKDYPDLIKKKGKKYSYKIDFYRFTDTSKRILGFDGGTSHLLKFLNAYRKESRGMHQPENQMPVVCVIDNDSGADPFLKWKDINGKKITRDGSPFHLFANVYLILTPHPAGKTESKIEDYFPASVLDTKISGRAFNSENKAVTDKEYGKHWFSTKVVWPNKSKINFDKFKDLLNLMDQTSKFTQTKA